MTQPHSQEERREAIARAGVVGVAKVPADVAARQLMGLYYELAGMPDAAADVRSEHWQEGSGFGPGSERELLGVMGALVTAVREEFATLDPPTFPASEEAARECLAACQRFEAYLSFGEMSEEATGEFLRYDDAVRAFAALRGSGVSPQGEDSAPRSRGTDLASVWRQAQDNHRRYSDTGDREGDIRFLTLGLTGEAGEVANFVKKRWRDGDGHDEDIRYEIADVCAYAFMLASTMGMGPDDLMGVIAHKQDVFVRKMKARADDAPKHIFAFPIPGWRLEYAKFDAGAWIVQLLAEDSTPRHSRVATARSTIGLLEAWDEAIKIALSASAVIDPLCLKCQHPKSEHVLDPASGRLLSADGLHEFVEDQAP